MTKKEREEEQKQYLHKKKVYTKLPINVRFTKQFREKLEKKLNK